MAVSTGTALLVSALVAGGTAAYSANEQRKNARQQRFDMAQAASRAEADAQEQARGAALQQQSASASDRAAALAEQAAQQSAAEVKDKVDISVGDGSTNRNRRAVRQTFGVGGSAGGSGSIRV